MTWAQMPTLSMYSSRACALCAAGSTSSNVGGGLSGANSQPAGALAPTVDILVSPITQISRPLSSRTIRGTSSRYRCGTRAVQTSGDSVICESLSTIQFTLAFTAHLQLGPDGAAA